MERARGYNVKQRWGKTGALDHAGIDTGHCRCLSGKTRYVRPFLEGADVDGVWNIKNGKLGRECRVTDYIECLAEVQRDKGNIGFNV